MTYVKLPLWESLKLYSYGSIMKAYKVITYIDIASIIICLYYL